MRTKFDVWLSRVNEARKNHHLTWILYESDGYRYPLITAVPTKERDYIKLIDKDPIYGTSIWGFVSMIDGINKGFPVKRGDLLRASGNSPAKWSRGNIFDGTDEWEPYSGPVKRDWFYKREKSIK